MQKKIIALAIAGLASSAAFAQTNVTIYGVADATLDYVSAVNGVNNDTAAGAGDSKGRTRVTSNSSYIGFKGVEDLGNGLKAVFQFENGLNTDNGAAGAWNNRDSYVGLTGGFGTLVMGNLTGPTRALGVKMDVNSGATGVGSNSALLGKFGGLTGGAGDSIFDKRLNNAIAYISPTVAGFNAVVGYTAGTTFAGNNFGALAPFVDNTTAEAQPAGRNTVRGNQGYTAGVNYAGGPVEVGYAYTTVEFNVDDRDSLVDRHSNHRIGVIGKIGTVAQINALIDYTSNRISGLGVSNQTVYYIGGKVNVGKGAVISQFGLANDVQGVAVQGVQNTGARHFVLGYEHYLSKRTTLKAVYSKIYNEENAQYDFLYGSGAGANTAAANNSAPWGADPMGLSIGIRHAF